VLLQADNLRFRYGTRLGDSSRAATASASPSLVIDDVSVRVPRGAVVGILGPNGSGKTTLFKLLSGALRPISGQVALDGRPLSAIGRRQLAKRVAVVSQHTQLAFDYTALEVVLMGRYAWLNALEVEGPDDLAAAFDALSATGTRPFAARPFPTLSGGEQQRVVIAAALAQLDRRTDTHRGEPALLFLDEPTASLDLKYQIEIGNVVRRLHEDLDITVLLSTHDLRLVSRLCTWIILLSEGRVLAEGSPADTLVPDLIGRLYDVDADVAAPLLR
jgi:iron complex transport system ATP-binding protein